MIFPSLCILYLLWREYTRRKVLYEKKVSEEIQTRRGSRENSRIDLGKKICWISNLWYLIIYCTLFYCTLFVLLHAKAGFPCDDRWKSGEMFSKLQQRSFYFLAKHLEIWKPSCEIRFKEFVFSNDGNYLTLIWFSTFITFNLR